jgi:branched-chain amino acid transport system permease protein
MEMMKKNEIVVTSVMMLLGLIAPWVVSTVWQTVLSMFYYYALLAISWNIIFGYAGLFSFCHVTFAAIGGYTSAMLAEHIGLSPFLGLIAGGLMAGLAGTFLGLLILRVHGFYLCLVTWAFGAVVTIAITAEHQLTGGTGGFLAPSFIEGRQSELYAYFVGLALMLIMFVTSAVLYHSRWGLYLFAVRDDIDAAECMGIRTRVWKVFGFAFGSAWAGVAGAYYAHFFNLVDPSIGGLDELGKVFLMCIIGGLGTVLGPLIGAFFVVITSEIIRGGAAQLSMLIFAIVMILAIRFVSGGFMEIIRMISIRLGYRPIDAVGERL